MSSPPDPSTPVRPRVRKRARSPSVAQSSPLAAASAAPRRVAQARGGTRNSSPDSTLPPSSPLPVLYDTDDDRDVDESEIPDDLPPQAVDEDDDEGENLFDENLEADYASDEGLDRYSDTGLDDENEFEAMTAAQRRAAEADIARRQAGGRAGRGGRAAARRRGPGFIDDDEDEDEDMDDERGGALRGIIPAGVRVRTRHTWNQSYNERQDIDDAAGADDDEELPFEQLSDIKASSITEWIAQPRVRKTIETQFRHFLVTYVDENGNSVYGERIRTLGEINSESLEVSYVHLSESKALLAYFLANNPSDMLDIFDAVALETILLYYPAYERIHRDIHVRITDVPAISTLRDLRRNHLNSLVRVSGVVTRRTGVMPQLKYVKFDCGKCGVTLGPYYQDTNKEVKIALCPNCEGRGPFTVNTEQTVYRNYQKMTLQESPGSVPAGRLPRHREVILLWDLIDSAKPGEEIEVTGVYRNNFDASLNVKNGFPVFSTVIEANHVNKKEDLFAAFRLTEEDERNIRKMSKDKRIAMKIIKSIAPSIYGHENIKTAIALSLFGGEPKNINRKHPIRGDINVLLLGDPGTAKSQFLKYVEKTAHRAVFATGQGASAVGLTASVRKDPVTREWTLEGGALVLADKGTCLIDEFDKMNDADRTSIHEAMEQQSISISKAGIVTTLQARCAIVAAANPTRGRYNPTIPFQQNVELTEPILSRFDVLCVVKDTVDAVKDEQLARFVIGSHTRSHPRFDREEDEPEVLTTTDTDLLDQDLLRKYIMYARERVHPQLHDTDSEKLMTLYAHLRKESLATGSFPVTVRHFESTIRMAEASAKMHLRDIVTSDDINLAIKVTVGSFISAQKMSIKKTLERAFRKYIVLEDDKEELASYVLGQIVKEKLRAHQAQYYAQPDQISVAITEFEERAKDQQISDAQVRAFLDGTLFTTNRYTLSNGQIIKTFAMGG